MRTARAQAQQGTAQRYCQIAHGLLRNLLARMFAEGVCHFVADHHGQFVIRHAHAAQQAGIDRHLAARHHVGVKFVGVDQHQLPGPARCIRAELCHVRHQAAHHGIDAVEFGTAGHQRTLGARLGILLGKGLLCGLHDLGFGHHHQLRALAASDGAGRGAGTTSQHGRGGDGNQAVAEKRAQCGHGESFHGFSEVRESPFGRIVCENRLCGARGCNYGPGRQ